LASNSGIEDLQATIDNLRQDQLGKKLNCTGRTKFYFENTMLCEISEIWCLLAPFLKQNSPFSKLTHK
jgi:hypothetical protein